MFSGFKTDRDRQGPAAAVIQMLHDAGCEIRNDHDLQMGMVSYSTALLVSGRPHSNSNKRVGRPALTSPAGRNDPCPCGSGRKYKKCCLDKNRTLPADSHLAGPFRFG